MNFAVHQINGSDIRVVDSDIPRGLASKFGIDLDIFKMVRFCNAVSTAFTPGTFSLGYVAKNQFLEIWALEVDRAGMPYITPDDVEAIRKRVCPRDITEEQCLLHAVEKTAVEAWERQTGCHIKVHSSIRRKAGMRDNHQAVRTDWSNVSRGFRP